MTTLAFVLLALAAVLHVYICWIETVAWDSDRTRATFGIANREDSLTTRPLAFNQGFYNLFLAIGVVVGLLLQTSSHESFGRGLVWMGAGSMVAAALVLLLSDRSKLRPALMQMTLPLLGLLAWLLA
ncbi:DUF1304 domain-containing protein [Luteococcus peritonei]|uniref:DUF1304 domain-containing protein n=1 Tax=Luteococcus peritonei TaxID=88874 RepID=A0ABW4RVM7_9ACTN